MMKFSAPTPDIRSGHNDVVPNLKARRQNAITTSRHMLDVIVDHAEQDALRSSKAGASVLDMSNHFNPLTPAHRQMLASYAKLEAGEINLSQEAGVQQSEYAQEVLETDLIPSIDRVKGMSKAEVDAEFTAITQASGIEEPKINPIYAQAQLDIARNARTTREIQDDIEETARQ